ncbi:MAG: 16S rRNA (cytosine(967)-C(5))-methyltransferase RsmB [Pedosphaera sp.]|nr:16S rRNA (cytosine(967)-C(5))-methyltransferase RsmB [Pedosphaera sp.]
MSNQKPREIAVRALRCHENSIDYIEDILEKEFGRISIPTVDRGLAQELTYGVVRWRSTLDRLIDQKARGSTQKPALRILLRLGLYQIFWLDRIPNHASVNETVEMAKQLGFGQQAGFLNAVLRGYIREQSQTERLLEDLKVQQPSLGFSHPEWLCARWEARWGREKTARLLEWNNRPAQIFARLNTLRAEPSKLLAQWRDEGVEYDSFSRDWTGENLVFALKSFPLLRSLPSFVQGLFYVQDPSTLLAARALNPQPGETVLDLCAAPGGKTTFIAQEIGNRGRIIAEDIAADRLLLIRQNCTRLGVTCVEERQSPSVNSQPPTHYDRVLVDAPCSNSGVIRRRIDLRWRIRPGEIERLRKAQLELLDRAASQLKPGGTLAYSTCSLEPEENREVTQEFLHVHSDFKLQSERELLPFIDEVDGAYVAVLVKQQ